VSSSFPVMKAVVGRGALGALLVCAALAAPAQATIRQGAGSDPAGDSTGGPGTDITQVTARADDAGSAAIAIQTSAPSSVWLVGVAGTLSGSSCGAPFVLFLASPSTNEVAFSRNGGETKQGQISVDGSTVTMSGSDPSIAMPFNCAIAYTLPSGNTNLNAAYDNTVGAPVTLVAETPPAATPTPVPTPAAPAPTPAPTVAKTPPVPVSKAPKLTLAFGGAPATIKRNKSMTLTLKIANDGSRKSSAVSVSFGRPRGLSGVSAKPKKLPALKPAQKRTLKLKVKLTRSAKLSTTLNVTVKAGKVKASSAVVLRIGKAKKAVPQPEAAKSPIVGTFWWRNVNHVDYAWDNRALYFVDGGTVYSGFPKGGLPAACTTPVAEPDDEVDTREGCLPYTFDAKSGAVTIGDKAGTFKDGKLTIDGNEYTPLVVPAAGARYTITEQKHTSFSGFCGFITGCTTSQEYLTLTPDGQFVLTRSTLSTMGDPGFGPYTAVGSYPPDQHGTYEVQAGGKIVLTYADGTVRVETFAEDTKDGQPSPTGEGVFIGEDNYYPDPFPDG
jgi:hypothetical protein